MKRLTSISIAVVALMMVSSLAFAQGWGRGGRSMGRGFGPGHRAGPGAGQGFIGCILVDPQMNLTDDQRKAFEALVDEMEDADYSEVVKLKRTRRDMMKAMIDPSVSVSDVKRKAKAVGDGLMDIHQRRTDLMLRVRDLLNPEQLKTLKSLPCVDMGRGMGGQGRGFRRACDGQGYGPGASYGRGYGRGYGYGYGPNWGNANPDGPTSSDSVGTDEQTQN